MKSFLQTIVEARELISDPAHWCQETYAENEKGEVIKWRSGKAVAFCAMGALYRACGQEKFIDGYFGVINEAFEGNVVTANDEGPHERVLAGFDRLIAFAKGTEA